MFGIQTLGKAANPLPEGETALVSVATGPVGTLPEGVSESDFTPDMNRPGSDGGSQSMEDESHGSTEEVPRRAA